jgi:hypothetical protein
MQAPPFVKAGLLRSVMRWRPGASAYALVALNQAEVADKICSEDRRQFALLTGQWNLPRFCSGS